jgi:hypothetical protein
LSQKASDLRPIKLDQDNEDLRKKVEALVDEHVKDIYSTGVSAVYTSVCIIILSATIINFALRFRLIALLSALKATSITLTTTGL